MYRYQFIALLSIVTLLNCNRSSHNPQSGNQTQSIVKEALLTTNFTSFEELKSEMYIQYYPKRLFSPSQVSINHTSNNRTVSSELKTGVSETDFINAKKGDNWDRIALGLKSPYAVANRQDLLKAYILARRRYDIFGEGDIAFYDFAEKMVRHITLLDLKNIPQKDLSEKGYLNTFNHITAQAFMTTIFSERMADFISDVHERNRLPELISGQFSSTQLADIDNGPVDNYIDIVNNEWGQELGKVLKAKYHINHETTWTPELLANYLNDVQEYFSWSLGIGLKPFRMDDEILVRFSKKMKRVMEDSSDF